MNVEFNISHVCNASCEWCNRAIDLLHFPNMTMTVEQVRNSLAVILDSGIQVDHVFVAGGEPTTHPDLEEIVRTIDETLPDLGKQKSVIRPSRRRVRDRSPERSRGEVSTNGIVKNRPPLPTGWSYYEMGLRNSDPRSGKSDHFPWFISPADHGFEASHEKCIMWRNCGIGVDACGFSMCSAASTFGRLLRINPYFDSPHENEEPFEMCKHCINGLTRKEQKKLHKIAPPIDARYKAAVERFKECPVEFPRKFE